MKSNAKRIEELKSQFSLIFEGVVTDCEKLKVLIEHLKVYWKRWDGFVVLGHVDLDASIDSALFWCMRAAQAGVNDLLKSGADESFPFEQWRRFEDALDLTERQRVVENIGSVRKSFEEFWSAWTGAA